MPGMMRGKKQMRGGGSAKLKMVEKDGKQVPFYAADGIGKMMRGGQAKKKMMRGGMAKKNTGYKSGGCVMVKTNQNPTMV